MFEQTPSAPATQDLHAAVHAWSQQTPCAQNPLLHSAVDEHDAPLVLSPHELFAQTLGDTHCVLLVHEVKHLVALQPNGAQGRASGATHWPLALHIDAGVKTLETQVSSAQMVLTGYFWQPPLPSHRPLVPQVDAACTAHIARGSGLPAATGMQ